MPMPVGYGEETADGWHCPPAMAQDALSPDELDVLCAYMSSPMHLGILSKGPPAKSCWEDLVLRTGRFAKNEFVASVLEHWADQEEPAWPIPPTWGDLYRPTQPQHQPQPAAKGRQNFQDGVMTRKGDGRETWEPDAGTPESRQEAVSSVVNVPKEA